MNISTGLLATGATIMLVIGMAACNKNHPAESIGKSIDQTAGKIGDKMIGTAKNPRTQSNMVSDALDNREITAKVRTAILGDTDLRVLRIWVETTDGVTTLSGSVDSQLHSDKASEIAGTVAGVKGVDNQLIVKLID